MAASRDDPTTSEMRHDWLTDRWVIMAPQRTARPVDFVRQPTRTIGREHCPFCFGHEVHTPVQIACYVHGNPPAGQPNWHVRVVPNKFPAVSGAVNCQASNPECQDVEIREFSHASQQPSWLGSSSRLNGASGAATELGTEPTSNLFKRRELSGGHEVIIEGPQHAQSLSELDLPTMRLVFAAYRDRLRYWLAESDAEYAVLFKNVGQEAGASLVHSHSQLIATNILPTDVARSLQRMEQFWSQEGECLICRTLEDELQQQVRIVQETNDLVAFCPFASRMPSLVTITSKRHQSQFELLEDGALVQLSNLMHELIRRIEVCYPDAAYNFVIHTAPRGYQGSPAIHWRIELFPRISTLAGFEWGSECFINPLLPETAARMLRSASI